MKSIDDSKKLPTKNYLDELKQLPLQSQKSVLLALKERLEQKPQGKPPSKPV
jgi:hypothetical protein